MKRAARARPGATTSASPVAAGTTPLAAASMPETSAATLAVLATMKTVTTTTQTATTTTTATTPSSSPSSSTDTSASLSLPQSPPPASPPAPASVSFQSSAVTTPNPIPPPRARTSAYLTLVATPTTGLFRSARRARARYFVTLDARAAELSARHTPQAPPAWVASLAGARLRLVDADCRIDVRHAARDEDGPWVFSLLVENRAEYERWKVAFELIRRGGRALREGGPVDNAFREHYSFEPIENVRNHCRDETMGVLSSSRSSSDPTGGSQQKGSGSKAKPGGESKREISSRSTVGLEDSPRSSAPATPQLLPNNDESEPLMMRCWDNKTGVECVATRILSQRSPSALNAARVAALKGGADLPLVPLIHTFQRKGAAIEVSPAYPLGTLGKLIEGSESLPMALVVRLCRDMIAAISCLHEAQLVHRAITPQSFFIHDELLSSSQPASQSTGQMSREGESHKLSSSQANLRAVLGRFDYVCEASDVLPEEPGSRVLPMSPTLPPEVLLCEQYGAPADMWASGAALFRILTGRLPFEALSHLELFRAIERVDFAFTRSELDRIPAAAVDLVQNLLVRSPGDRLTAKDALQHPFLRREQAAGPTTAARILAEQQRLPGQASTLVGHRMSTAALSSTAVAIPEDPNDGECSIGSTSDDLEIEDRPSQFPRRLPQGFRKTFGTLRRQRPGNDVDLTVVSSLAGLRTDDSTDARESRTALQLPPALPRFLTESEGEIGPALLGRLDYPDYNPSPVSGQSPVPDSEMDDFSRQESGISAPRSFDFVGRGFHGSRFSEMQPEAGRHHEFSDARTVWDVGSRCESSDALTVWDTSFKNENSKLGTDLSLSVRLPDRERWRSVWQD